MTEQTALPELDWLEIHNDAMSGCVNTRASVTRWLTIYVTRIDHNEPFVLRSPIVAAYQLSATELAAAQREAEIAVRRQLEHALKMLRS